jgi:hypothetical protein
VAAPILEPDGRLERRDLVVVFYVNTQGIQHMTSECRASGCRGSAAGTSRTPSGRQVRLLSCLWLPENRIQSRPPPKPAGNPQPAGPLRNPDWTNLGMASDPEDEIDPARMLQKPMIPKRLVIGRQSRIWVSFCAYEGHDYWAPRLRRTVLRVSKMIWMSNNAEIFFK